jgi:hypothetical protein
VPILNSEFLVYPVRCGLISTPHAPSLTKYTHRYTQTTTSLNSSAQSYHSNSIIAYASRGGISSMINVMRYDREEDGLYKRGNIHLYSSFFLSVLT